MISRLSPQVTPSTQRTLMGNSNKAFSKRLPSRNPRTSKIGSKNSKTLLIKTLSLLYLFKKPKSSIRPRKGFQIQFSKQSSLSYLTMSSSPTYSTQHTLSYYSNFIRLQIFQHAGAKQSVNAQETTT